MRHSSEPWRTGEEEADKGRIGWASLIFSTIELDEFHKLPLQVAEATHGSPDGKTDSAELAVANAKRIVLCVNACAGKTNEELEEMINAGM